MKRRIEVHNETTYCTRTIRRLLVACLRRVKSRATYKRLEVRWRRTNYGRGVVGGGRRGEAAWLALYLPRWAWVPHRVPHGAYCARDAARTILHELCHNHGMQHRDGLDATVAGLMGDGSWLPVQTIPNAAAKARPTPAERAAALVAKREARARAMLAEHERRLKWEGKLVQKWRVRVRYYERRKAARKGEPE